MRRIERSGLISNQFSLAKRKTQWQIKNDTKQDIFIFKGTYQACKR
jgi:hypothetical protein